MVRRRNRPPVPPREDEISEALTRYDEAKRDDKGDKRDDKQEHKLDKKDAKANLILAKAQKSLAAAQKRKWLVILIVVAIGAFYAIKSGGINFGGIIDKVKGWMP